MSTVIQLENISKLYRLGTISSGTVRDDFSRWWAKINKKDDPFQKIGERNIQNKSGKSDQIWALKDINLAITPSENIGFLNSARSNIGSGHLSSHNINAITSAMQPKSMPQIKNEFHPIWCPLVMARIKTTRPAVERNAPTKSNLDR